jgi:hypothetical protein
MIGLKTYLSTLAPRLGQTHDMLYERQRALMRHGLLESVEGHGRGSGVRADEKALAVFLISLLAHDLLVLTFVAKIFCMMKNDEGKCPVTGARTFQEAMQRVLGDEKLAARVTSPAVRVDRGNPGSAHLLFGGKTKSSARPSSSRSTARASTPSSPSFPRPSWAEEIVVPPTPPTTSKTRIINSAFRNKGLFRPIIPPSDIHVSTSVDAALIQQIAKDIAQFKKDSAS